MPGSARRFALVILAVALCVYMVFQSTRQSGSSDDGGLLSSGLFTTPKIKHGNNNNTFGVQQTLSLSPGELPGYTGWGRPEFTLAGYFQVLNAQDGAQWIARVGQPWTIEFQCHGHSLCTTSTSWFFVRAYGPSVLTGRVEKVQDSQNIGVDGALYRAIVEPVVDPGVYTLEIVVTFSDPPSIESFPIQSASESSSSNHVFYEGYLLPSFPRMLYVENPSQAFPAKAKLPLCKVDDLTIRNVNDGLARGRWKVTDMIRHSSHSSRTDDTNQITLGSYQRSWNSIGVAMEYRFTDCLLMKPPTPQINPFVCVKNKQQPVHIILIGDSAMRLQYEMLQQFLQGIGAMARVHFHELYGGYYLTQLLKGPKLRPLLQQRQPGFTKRIILFNTGLHDIHRLCGSEYATERKTYLHGDMQTSSCASLYRLAVLDLFNAIQESVAESDGSEDETIAIFQTTTAGWPKYGNWGVNWDPRFGQPLPLDASFVYQFNQIALEALKPYLSNSIHAKKSAKLPLFAVDSFWVSMARPDHREIDKQSNIGKKLSHPGLEAVQAIVQEVQMLKPESEVIDLLDADDDSNEEATSVGARKKERESLSASLGNNAVATQNISMNKNGPSQAPVANGGRVSDPHTESGIEGSGHEKASTLQQRFNASKADIDIPEELDTAGNKTQVDDPNPLIPC